MVRPTETLVILSALEGKHARKNIDKRSKILKSAIVVKSGVNMRHYREPP
jgi:hypothetical protein